MAAGAVRTLACTPHPPAFSATNTYTHVYMHTHKETRAHLMKVWRSTFGAGTPLSLPLPVALAGAGRSAKRTADTVASASSRDHTTVPCCANSMWPSEKDTSALCVRAVAEHGGYGVEGHEAGMATGAGKGRGRRRRWVRAREVVVCVVVVCVATVPGRANGTEEERSQGSD